MSVKPHRRGITRPVIDDHPRRGVGRALGDRRVPVERIEAGRYD